MKKLIWPVLLMPPIAIALMHPCCYPFGALLRWH
jgi:hypothetical protein